MHSKNKEKKQKPKKEKNVLLLNDEFTIFRNDKKIYLNNKGKLKQDINYTLVPKEEIRTNKTKVIILSIALGIFLCLGFVAMSFV